MTTTSEHQPVFPDLQAATNMPFFDGETLVFCQSTGTVQVRVPAVGTIWKAAERNKALAERLKNLPRHHTVRYRPWKLAYCGWEDRIVRPIRTGLPANITERSPAFYREGDGVHLSFLGGNPTPSGFFYRLYACSGPDLAHMEPPRPLFDHPAFFGFASPQHLCWGVRNVVQLKEKATGRMLRLTTSFFRVSSVTFLAEDPAKLLLTGLIDREFHCRTVLYDLATGNLSDVSVGGPVYKSSLHRNHLIFTERKEEEFEDRELRHGDCTLSPSAIVISKE